MVIYFFSTNIITLILEPMGAIELPRQDKSKINLNLSIEMIRKFDSICV